MSPEFYDDLQLWLKENGKIETTIDAKEYFNNHLLFNRTSKNNDKSTLNFRLACS